MDMGTVRGLVTLALMVAFAGLVIRLFGRRRKHDFDAAARLPLEEDGERDARTTGRSNGR